MSATPRILVVEDDASVRDAVVEYLQHHGFDVEAVADGVQMDRALDRCAADLIVLDIMLPGEDGLSICRRLNGVPILILSAMGSTIDRVIGLELGAWDYLSKPFEPRELLARVRAILRRDQGPAASEAATFTFAGFRFTPDETRLLDPEGRAVDVTARDVRLLEAFARHPGRVLTRARLIDWIYGEVDGPYERAIDLAVSRLRRKLVREGAPQPIETVRGLGYRLRPEAGR